MVLRTCSGGCVSHERVGLMTGRPCPSKGPVHTRTARPAPAKGRAPRHIPRPNGVSAAGGSGPAEWQALQPIETQQRRPRTNGRARTSECSRKGRGREVRPAVFPPLGSAWPSAERSGGHGGEGAQPQSGGGPCPGRAGRQHQRGPRAPGCAADQPGP